jgi:hypothetical protein
LIRVDLVELSRRNLANYDARAQGACDGEDLDMTTDEAYVLAAVIARLREQQGQFECQAASTQIAIRPLLSPNSTIESSSVDVAVRMQQVQSSV